MTKQIVTQCSVDRCERVTLAKGLCGKHYQRWRQFGDPLFTKICRTDDSNFEILFWQSAMVTADINKCWEWQKARNESGYGKLCLKRPYKHLYTPTSSVMTHRLAYAIYYQTDPADMCVCHTCDNPACVNPHHLWLGTVGDNNTDRCQKGRYDTLFGNYYFPDEVIRDIRERVNQGESRRSVARHMQVSHKTISQIVARKTYNHVT